MERLNEYQAVTAKWKEKLNPPREGSLSREYKRLQEENKELGQAIEEGNLPHVAEEAGDMIIGLLQIVHESGADAESILSKKLEVMFNKYSPEKHAQLREKGHSFESALREQKTIWQQKK